MNAWWIRGGLRRMKIRLRLRRRRRLEQRFHPLLDIVDGAARILDPHYQRLQYRASISGAISEGLQADGLVVKALLLNIFILHAVSDAPFAEELKSFLEAGCDGIFILPDSAIRNGQDLLSTAETVDSADALVLLLSPASNPARWRREIWEPLIAGHTHVATLLLEECTFPLLLRRGSGFFDGTTTRLAAMRQLKRWIWGHPSRHFACDRRSLDGSGHSLYVAAWRSARNRDVLSGPMAERFAASGSFTISRQLSFGLRRAGGHWIQIAGDLGGQLETDARWTAPGELRDVIREVLGAQALSAGVRGRAGSAAGSDSARRPHFCSVH